MYILCSTRTICDVPVLPIVWADITSWGYMEIYNTSLFLVTILFRMLVIPVGIAHRTVRLLHLHHTSRMDIETAETSLDEPILTRGSLIPTMKLTSSTSLSLRSISLGWPKLYLQNTGKEINGIILFRWPKTITVPEVWSRCLWEVLVCS